MIKNSCKIDSIKFPIKGKTRVEKTWHCWGKAALSKEARGKSKIRINKYEERERSPWTVVKVIKYQAAFGLAGSDTAL